MPEYEEAYKKAMGEKKKKDDKSLTAGQPPARPPEPPRYKESLTAGQPPERPPEPPRYQEPKPVTDVIEQAKILGLPGGAEPMLRPVEDTGPKMEPMAQPAPVVPAKKAMVESAQSPNIPGSDALYDPNYDAVRSKLKEALGEVQKDPSIGQKLLGLAKDTGKSVLELIQGFAYGYAGSDKPLASEVREAEKMKQMDVEAQTQQRIAEEQFQMTLAQLNNEWMQKRFTAATEAEKAAADEEYKVKKSEAAQDRASNEKIAGMRQGEQKKAGVQQAVSRIVDYLRGQQ